MLSINEFVEAIGNKYGYEYIRQLIKSKVIKSEIVKGHYAIYPEEVEKILSRNVRRGRPVLIKS